MGMRENSIFLPVLSSVKIRGPFIFPARMLALGAEILTPLDFIVVSDMARGVAGSHGFVTAVVDIPLGHESPNFFIKSQALAAEALMHFGD